MSMTYSVTHDSSTYEMQLTLQPTYPATYSATLEYYIRVCHTLQHTTLRMRHTNATCHIHKRVTSHMWVDTSHMSEWVITHIVKHTTSHATQSCHTTSHVTHFLWGKNYLQPWYLRANGETGQIVVCQLLPAWPIDSNKHYVWIRFGENMDDQLAVQVE